MSKLQRMWILTSVMSFWREGGAYQGWNIGGLEQPSHKKWLFVSPCAIARGIRWDPHPQPIRVSRLFINHTLQSFLHHFSPSMLPDTTRDDAELTSNSAGIRRIHLQYVPRWSQPKALVEDSMRPFLQEAFMSNGLGTQGLSQRWVIMKDDIWDYKSTSLAKDFRNDLKLQEQYTSWWNSPRTGSSLCCHAMLTRSSERLWAFSTHLAIIDPNKHPMEIHATTTFICHGLCTSYFSTATQDKCTLHCFKTGMSGISWLNWTQLAKKISLVIIFGC